MKVRHDADREEKYPQDTAFFEQIAAAAESLSQYAQQGRKSY